MKKGGASVTGVVDTTGGASGRALTEEVAVGRGGASSGREEGKGRQSRYLTIYALWGVGPFFFN